MGVLPGHADSHLDHAIALTDGKIAFSPLQSQNQIVPNRSGWLEIFNIFLFFFFSLQEVSGHASEPHSQKLISDRLCNLFLCPQEKPASRIRKAMRLLNPTCPRDGAGHSTSGPCCRSAENYICPQVKKPTRQFLVVLTEPHALPSRCSLLPSQEPKSCSGTQQGCGKGMPSGSGMRMLKWEGAKVPGGDVCSRLQPAVTLAAVLAGHASTAGLLQARKSPSQPSFFSPLTPAISCFCLQLEYYQNKQTVDLKMQLTEKRASAGCPFRTEGTQANSQLLFGPHKVQARTPQPRPHRTHHVLSRALMERHSSLPSQTITFIFIFFPFGIKQLQFWVWMPFFFTCCADQQGARSVHQQLQASARLFLPNYFI